MDSRRKLGFALICALAFAAPMAWSAAADSEGAAVSQAGNAVDNGNFERPSVPEGSFNTYVQGQSFGGWTVGFGNVDHVGTYWDAGDGTQSVNLNGTTAGSVFQNVATKAGQRYELRFLMAANPDVAAFTATMRVLWDGAEIASPNFNSGGHSISDLGWERRSYTVTATQAVTRLEFASGNTSGRGDVGPVLDDVTVSAPSSTLSQLNANNPPTLGEDVNVGEVNGKVLIAVPSRGARTAQKGVEFVPLKKARQIPVGSVLDTTDGTVALSSAKDRAGKIQTGKFAAGLFQVLQSRKRAAKGLTELRMKGSAAGFRSCRSGNNSANASALSRRAIRRLRARARGRFRTGGRYSAATVRGTSWTVEDRCDGTLTTVKRGTVAVRDFRRKKTIVVSAGKSYLAAAAGASNFLRIP